MLKLVKTKQPSTLYFRAARLFKETGTTDKILIADVLECSVGTARSLLSYYNTCGGDPLKMQEKANESSRRSKRKAA